MESKQSFISPVQSVLSENRYKCVTVLSYSEIASFLISHSVLSENQHVTIKNASADSTDRMDALLTFLYQLNSVDAFDHFRNGIIASGHFDLAESLKLANHQRSELSPVLNPTILTKVFAYLPKKELWNIRRVCNTWNDVICSSKFMSHTILLKSLIDLDGYVKSNTKFCASTTNFRLSVGQFSAADRSLWIKFCERFGNNIKSLDLTKLLHRGVVELIFSNDIQKFFVNLIRFRLNVSLEPSFVERTPLSFLAQLKHLTVEATEERSEYGQIAFLSKLLKLDHQLESIALRQYFCAGDLPSDISQNLFRTNTIESIEVVSQPHLFRDNDFIAMTNKKNATSKLQSFKFVNVYCAELTIAAHQFLVSHRHSLKRITFSLSNVFVTDLPKLDSLKYLNGEVHMKPDALSFCTQFPNLKELELVIIGKIDIHRLTHFEHNALRSLRLTLQPRIKGSDSVRLDDGEMTALKSFIRVCCPGLTTLEVQYD